MALIVISGSLLLASMAVGQTDGALDLSNTAAVGQQLSTVLREMEQLKEQVRDLTRENNVMKKRFVVDGEVDFEQKLLKMEQELAVLKLKGTGSTYVRWGRSTCPGNGTDLVYSGFAGGSFYTQGGGAANYICLPRDPVWGFYVDGHQSGADVYGAEYEYRHDAVHFTSSQYSQFFGSDVQDQDAPCAVCRPRRSSSLMIPGRNICYPGWTQEYAGYLVGGLSDHSAASEFVCMDGSPEAIQHGAADQNGKLFYIAEVNCGSLTCPPYVDGRELTCVVCSQ